MIPQPSHKNAFVVTLDAFVKNIFVSPQVGHKSAFVNTLVAFVKKQPPKILDDCETTEERGMVKINKM